MSTKRKREEIVVEISSEEEDEDFDDFDDIDSDEEGSEEEEYCDIDHSIGKPVNLWVARWPNGDFTLLSARNKLEAVEILDELQDPGHAIISEYHGPLFFDFTHQNSPYELGEDVVQNLVTDFDTKERTSSLHKQFEFMYKNKKGFDITINFNDSKTGKKESVRAHKMFLCSYSRYLNMFFESNEDKTQVTIGKSLSITRDHVEYFLDTLYTGYSNVNTNLEFLLEIIKLGLQLVCDYTTNKACKEIMNKIRFGFEIEIMVKILNYAHKTDLLNVFFKAIATVAQKQTELLRKAGLDSDICDKLLNWNDSNEYMVWADNSKLVHEFVLSRSKYSTDDACTMWSKLKKQVFPKSYNLQKKPSLFKKAFTEECNECSAQSKKAKLDNPQLVQFMAAADLTSMDLISGYMNTFLRK